MAPAVHSDSVFCPLVPQLDVNIWKAPQAWQLTFSLMDLIGNVDIYRKVKDTLLSMSSGLIIAGKGCLILMC